MQINFQKGSQDAANIHIRYLQNVSTYNFLGFKRINDFLKIETEYIKDIVDIRLGVEDTGHLKKNLIRFKTVDHCYRHVRSFTGFPN